MPTIQYGGSPSGYADRGRAEFDDVYPTQVTATATVTNTGNAVGRAYMVIIHESDDGDYVWAGAESESVPIPGGGLTGDVRASRGLQRDAYMHLRAEVRVVGTDEVLATRSTSVNAYDVPPPVPNLSSTGGITIRVS